MLVKKKLHYTLNYKPFLGYKKNIRNSNLVYCKNFFLFFLILDNLMTNSSNSRYRVKINKSNKYDMSFLRAPNKYKKAQIKINIVRYHVIFECSRMYKLPASLQIANYTVIFNFVSFLFNFISFFESTLFYLRKKQLVIKLEPQINKQFFEL